MCCTELGNRNCAHSEFIIKQIWIKHEIHLRTNFVKNPDLDRVTFWAYLIKLHKIAHRNRLHFNKSYNI